ncbi:MAG: anthranilate phosphoribosyltransferase [Pirellulaceae bacterium]|nr:MAG: anthranilate phosphoribosyltransferase [Pirellulaceae bacterium]
MSHHPLASLIHQLRHGEHLTRQQMHDAVLTLLAGELPITPVKEFLLLLAERGETVEEIIGAAQALRETMVPLSSRHPIIADTCGTGGDGSKTFNISTAAAIVAAAAGVVVAKHGNRRITSSTGSADVLAELGVPMETDTQVVQQCLETLGLCFCFAPQFHPAMRHVAEVRRQIPRPTIFNRLGPLANPARASHQVLGVGDPRLQQMMAEALRGLHTVRSLVVRGEDGVDELSLSAPSRVLLVTQDSVDEMLWSPADFGLDVADRRTLHADSPAESAACIRAVLAGEPGPQRDVVVMNAAATVWLVGLENSLTAAAQRCADAIDSGTAARLLAELAAHCRRSGSSKN